MSVAGQVRDRRAVERPHHRRHGRRPPGQRDRSGIEAAQRGRSCRRVRKRGPADQHHLAAPRARGACSASHAWRRTARPRPAWPRSCGSIAQGRTCRSRSARSRAGAPRPSGRRVARSTARRASRPSLGALEHRGSLSSAMAAPRQPHEREAQPLELFLDRLDRSERVADEAPVDQRQRGQARRRARSAPRASAAQRPASPPARWSVPGAGPPAACRDRRRIDASSATWRATSARAARAAPLRAPDLGADATQLGRAVP